MKKRTFLAKEPGLIEEKGNWENAKFTKGTRNKPIRFPNDIIDKVKAVVSNNNGSFSAFVIAAVRNALEELEEK